MSDNIIMLVPHFSQVIHTQAALSIMGQLRFCEQVIFPSSMSQSLATIRNDLAEHALKTDCTHLLWLDGDELFPRDLTPCLLAHDKDIVAGWTVIRQDGRPNVYNIVSKNERGGYKHKPVYGVGLMKRDRVGFGSVLVKREVFEKLSKPWFFFDEHHDTEDLAFCDKAREEGFDLWVDYNLRCGHISQTIL